MAVSGGAGAAKSVAQLQLNLSNLATDTTLFQVIFRPCKDSSISSISSISPNNSLLTLALNFTPIFSLLDQVLNLQIIMFSWENRMKVRRPLVPYPTSNLCAKQRPQASSCERKRERRGTRERMPNGVQIFFHPKQPHSS